MKWTVQAAHPGVVLAEVQPFTRCQDHAYSRGIRAAACLRFSTGT